MTTASNTSHLQDIGGLIEEDIFAIIVLSKEEVLRKRNTKNLVL